MGRCFSERNLNMLVVPILKYKNYNSDFPKKFIVRTTFTAKSKESEMYNFWNSKNFMCMDFLSDLFCRFYFGCHNDDFIPHKKIDSKKFFCNEEKIKSLESAINNNESIPSEFEPYNLIFFENEVKGLYPHFEDKNADFFYTMLKTTSECEFKFLNNSYMIEVKDKNKKTKKIPININRKSNLFDFFPLKNEKNKNRNRGYTITISASKNPIGFMHFKNCMSVNGDWFNSEVYSLSETAQLIYRFFVLRQKLLQKEAVFYIDRIITRLNYSTFNVAASKRLIVNALEELKNIREISGFSFSHSGNVNIEYYYKLQKNIENNES